MRIPASACVFKKRYGSSNSEAHQDCITNRVQNRKNRTSTWNATNEISQFVRSGRTTFTGRYGHRAPDQLGNGLNRLTITHHYHRAVLLRQSLFIHTPKLSFLVERDWCAAGLGIHTKRRSKLSDLKNENE